MAEQLEFVSKEQAVKLKELRFVWLVDMRYFKNKPDIQDSSVGLTNYNRSELHNTCSAPTLDLASKWLRDKHGIFVMPDYNGIEYWVIVEIGAKVDKGGKRMERLTEELFDSFSVNINYNKWEQAQSAGIDYALDYLIKNKK